MSDNNNTVTDTTDDLTAQAIQNIPEAASSIIKKETENFIKNHPNSIKDKPLTCATALLNEINNALAIENSIRGKENKLPMLKELPYLSIAMLIASRDDVALIATCGDKSGKNRVPRLSTEKKMRLPIGIYQETGENAGTWELTNSSEDAFGILVEEYKPTAIKKDKQEIFILTKSRLKVITTCSVPYYAAFENGIWDDLNKKLISFSKDFVFTAKCHTNVNVNAKNPFIFIPEANSQWDVDSWLSSLGDADMVMSIKEVIAASLLNHTRFDKMVLLYAESGCNAKGTIAQLIRNILGEETVADIPIAEFSKTFGLSKLPGSSAIITDENKANCFSKGVAELKAVITGDVVTINRKYEQQFDYRFEGLVIECVNNLSAIGANADSFLRRLHIIEFENSFVANPKKYIKNRLIYLDEVKEYIVKLVMVDMPYFDSFTQTAATKAALGTYLKRTNPIVSYLDEILPEAQWDLLPATAFLYDGFKTWYKKISPSEKVCGRNDFIDAVKSVLRNDNTLASQWEWTDSCRSQGYIDPSVREPLLVELNLTDFTNPGYGAVNAGREYPDAQKIKSKYSGLKRISRATTGTTAPAANTAPDGDSDNN